MPSSAGQGVELLLVSVSGPTAVEQVLDPGGALSIGRRTTHGLVLDRPEVSRNHAELRAVDTASGTQWLLIDLNSRHKTRLNGQELRPGEPCPVRAGDLIEIAPWTFRLVDRNTGAATSVNERQVRTLDDMPPASMRTISPSRDLATERLRLLLSFAEAIGSAPDEAALAEALLEAATRGTGFPNAAVLRPLMPDGTVSIIAETGLMTSGGKPRLSRTLIHQASQGEAVAIGGDVRVSPEAHSIVELNIQEAICVPLMLEGAAAGFLYLDSRDDTERTAGRGGAPRRIAQDAGPFAAGLARLAAMALLNLHRRDLEMRYARMEGEISAAASTQRLILPPRVITRADLKIVGECRPGRIVSGDFFDVIPLDDGRVAVGLGDVAGKGIQASVLMTTTQGFLHGVLAQHGEPHRAVTQLNSYLHPRCESGRFLTLWLGVIDSTKRTLEYVNAGHGYAWLLGGREGAGARRLTAAGGPLVGVLESVPFLSATVEFQPGDRLLLLSDGILEQPHKGDRDEPFEWDGVQMALSEADGQEPEAFLAQLFASLYDYAGQSSLADDATVVMVKW
jgi:serine phosphatase RsbU (regulator of sigma subunit)/pSer/pThr/pTyr-binding forkhead associated (FHA) protein